MDLKKYITESERHYNYRLKTICSLDDYAMDWVERVLLKYLPVDISKPRKTILQKNPLDFKNVRAAEVWIVDITTALPASAYVLGQEIQLALGVPENHVIVRGANDPNEVESERLVAAAEIALDAAAKGLTPDALLNDPDYEEAEVPDELYGDKYNGKFLGYLRTVQKEREAKQKVDAPNAKFGWLNMPGQDVADDNGEFNANIDGAPGIGQPGPKPEIHNQGTTGALTDVKREYKRLYGKNGTRVVASRTMDTTKDPK